MGAKGTNLGWFAWKKRILVAILVLFGLLLVLRLSGDLVPSFLSMAIMVLVSVVITLAPFFIGVCSAIAFVYLVFRGKNSKWFLPRKRTYNVSGFAVSVLRLQSVPSQGVRQRVRGAVSRDEQDEGAAVSDEKQYQFSHLTSLFEKDGSARLNDGVCMGYEIHFKKGLVNVDFLVTARNMAESRRRLEHVKASLLSKFPIQLSEINDRRLQEAAVMGLVEPGSLATNLEVAVVNKKVAYVRGVHSYRCVCVVALVGRPEMSAHEQRSQIDQFITGVNSATSHGQGDDRVDARFIVSYKSAEIPEFPSDASLREKLREKPDVRLSLARKRIEIEAMEIEFGQRVGWWRVSAYAAIIGGSPTSVEESAESVASVLRSVWSGSHFSPDCIFLKSREVVKYFPTLLRRGLLPKKYITEMSSIRLSSLIHIPEEPHPPLSKGTPPFFEAPNPATTHDEYGGKNVTFGDVLGPSNSVLYPLILSVSVLGTHMVVFGESGFGKSSFVINLLRELLVIGSVPFLVLDQKGEYCCLLSCTNASIIYFLSASSYAPLYINLFDPQDDDPEKHAKDVFNIIREILFTNRTELTPQMERVLFEVLTMSIGGDWQNFNDNLFGYAEAHGDELPQLGATVQGILNRVASFTRSPLSHVFNCKRSNVNFSYLTQRNVIIDLSELRRMGTPEDVRLVANIIAKYVSAASLRRGANQSGKVKHLFVVDDALDVVPEILGKRTTADVGIIEYMAILLRATGQGLIVVSQRPNVSENVIANSALKVFFRTVVDSREVASWVNLSDEQQAYLKVLSEREAIITIPQHKTAIRIKAPDINGMLRSKLTVQDIIQNNMMQYPLMYDKQREEIPAQRKRNDEKGEETKREGDGGGDTQARGQEQGQKEGRVTERVEGLAIGRVDDGGVEGWEKLGVSKLSADDRESWSKLRVYLARGVVLDSDFASRMLGVSQPAAHRKMLSLKSAGLIGVAKVPNYAYGEGYQYVYYSQNKTVYGGGVVGYVRERIHDDLMGREAVASLSPKDVPSADMVVQNSYPLIIHTTSSSGSQGSRLSALNGRIRNVADEFNMAKGLHTGGGAGFDASSIIVVTLWKQMADELNKARREGKLKGCLCVMPFAKRWIDTLADYALNHITLQTLLGEKESDEELQEKESREETGEVIEKKKERGQGDQKRLEKERVIGDEFVGDNIQERILATIKELGGVEPRAVADRLGIALWKVSKAVNVLKKDGAIKIANNLPFISSIKKPNATYYLDAEKPTALHDTLTNMIWKENIELGGRCRDVSFEYGGKTWSADGLLENTGGVFILECVAGDYDERIAKQIQAYSTQVGHRSIKGVIVVALERGCIERIRKEVAGRGISLGDGLITSIRSKDEKRQFKSLILDGELTTYHHNSTS